MKFYFLPSITPKSWQKHKFHSYSNTLANFNNVNKEFLPKNPPKKSSPTNPPKKFLQKIRPKNSSKKILWKNFKKNFKKNSKQIQQNPKNSPKISEKIQKISKQLLKKFPIFRKCPISYIALGGRKPFRACFNRDLKLHNQCYEFFSTNNLVAKCFLSIMSLINYNYSN